MLESTLLGFDIRENAAGIVREFAPVVERPEIAAGLILERENVVVREYGAHEVAVVRRRKDNGPLDVRCGLTRRLDQMAKKDRVGAKSVQDDLHVTSAAKARKFSRAALRQLSTNCGSG